MEKKRYMDNQGLGTLLDAFGAFGQFNLGAYYVTCFGVLPSSLKVTLPSEKPRDAVEAVMQMLDLPARSFEPVSKDWRMDEVKKEDQFGFDEYAYDFLFKSEPNRAVIQIVCHHHAIELTFAYDVQDKQTETWMLDSSRQLQTTYKITDKPRFRVLIAQDGMFSTEEVETHAFDTIDISELYNDDFVDVDALICGAIERKESGMILLHGEPGTGKTTPATNPWSPRYCN
jgi:hypothetical protein